MKTLLVIVLGVLLLLCCVGIYLALQGEPRPLDWHD